METRIKKLDDQLSNQIAAGEVVERPGSALKELLENSLDAGATDIRIQFSGGGMQLLEIADNGRGIHPSDLDLALERHATSKISSQDDLFAIKTWGFRGEALASIAAVSRLTLNSKTTGNDTGREIYAEGGVLTQTKEIARPIGTTVKIEDLFYNTPARKKFLKSQAAETAFCVQTIYRLALGAPQTGFEVYADGKKLFHFSKNVSTETRMVDVFTQAWDLAISEKDLLKIEENWGPLKLQAWALPSKFFIPSTRGIFTFVNGRVVKDKLLQQAILAAAKEVLFGSQYPQLVLFLQMPFESVDVNVHPTKSEVRFRDSGKIFGLIKTSLEKALAGDRRGSVNFEISSEPTTESFFALPSTAEQSRPAFLAMGSANIESVSGYIAPQGQTTSAPVDTYQPLPQPNFAQFLGTVKNTYIVCQTPDALVLVDQHAAHERVTYERLKSTRLKGQAIIPLLVPIQIELPAQSLDRLEKQFAEFLTLGLSLDRGGPSLLTVRELPSLLVRRDGSPVLSLGKFFRDVCTSWDEVEENLAEKLKDKMLEVLASESCHGSVRAGQNLSREESLALLSQMSETDFSGHCPHGRPTTVKLKWAEIERLFKRIV